MITMSSTIREWHRVARRRTVCMMIGAAAVIMPAVVSAQSRTPAALTGRFSGSLFAQGTDPQGDFGRNTGSGWGLGGAGVWRLDDSGISHIRLDLGFVTYGSNTRRIDLANAGGLVKLDLNTTSSIFSMVAGPQIGGTVGPFAPYIAALGGFSTFWTSSSVKGPNDDADEDGFGSTTNASDAVLAYGGAAGATFRLTDVNDDRGGKRELRLDLGARLMRHDDVRYLNAARVKEAFDNNTPPRPIRGRADFVTYYLGINAVLF